MDTYEIAIIGSGPAGYVGAVKAARSGVPTCVIEEKVFGGVCLNEGCIPTKTLIASSKVLRHAQRAGDFGIDIEGPITASIAKLQERKDKVVDIERQGLMKLVTSSGADIINGRAGFADSNTLKVTSPEGERTISAASVIIATGSEPRSLPFMPFDGKKVFSSDNLLRIMELPETMVIVGGGYIGCEFASLFASLGVKVTIIEALPRIIMNVDEDISGILLREFKKEKIEVHTNCKIVGAEVNEAVSVSLEDGRVFTADVAVVAVGRRPKTAGLGLESIGIATQPNGAIQVNDQMMTNVPGVYAVGDVIGNPMLAHAASAECKVAVANALGNHRIMDYTVMPSAIYTYPEIGTVGLTEADARKMGMDVTVGTVHIRSLGISHAAGEITGMAKIVANAISDEVVGVHIMCDRAADILHEVAVAMFGGMTASALSRVIHAHPTFSESIAEAAQDVHGAALYVSKKAA